jgi:hypothetical protein
MDPPPEALVEESAADPLYDRAGLEALVRLVRDVERRSAPLRALALRRARNAAQALQTFFLTELTRRFLSGAARDAGRGGAGGPYPEPGSAIRAAPPPEPRKGGRAAR